MTWVEGGVVLERGQRMTMPDEWVGLVLMTLDHVDAFGYGRMLT